MAGLLFKHKKLIVKLPRQYGGKTELGVRLAYNLTSEPYTSTSLFIAKNTAARRKATREKFLRIFDEKTFHVNTEMIYLRNHKTSQLLMGSVDKDPDAQRGGTVHFLHWSEVAFSKIDHGETIPDVWQKVFRPMLSQTDGLAYLESTTNGHNGFKDLWDSAKELGFHTFSMSLSEMLQFGLISQEEYDKEKNETHPLIFDQEYECNWVTFQGLAYNEFNESEHVSVDVAPPEEWQNVISAIDFGYHPSATAMLFAYVKDEVVYIFDEIYEFKQRIEDLHESILAREVHWRIGRHACVADHEEDRIDELNLRGIRCGKANKVNVLGARIQIKELLWKNRLKIHPRCVHLIRDLRGATWNDKKEGDLDYGACTEGHYDAEAALRYLIRELSGSEADEPDENPHKDIDDASARAWAIQRMG